MTSFYFAYYTWIIYNLPVAHPKLGALMRFCQMHNIRIPMCADTNCHSTLWNGLEDNLRGNQMEDVIVTWNLDIHNCGTHPTYAGKTGQTIIDVTFRVVKLVIIFTGVEWTLLLSFTVITFRSDLALTLDQFHKNGSRLVNNQLEPIHKSYCCQ